MKLTPQEKKIRRNFEQGTLSKSGFMGNDVRHIHDIIAEDARVLERLGMDCERLADRLKSFIEIGKEGLESHVTQGHFRIRVIWDRGKIPCPFGESGVHSLIMAEVENIRNMKSIQYTQLSVHLIRKHGFLGGKGSKFRIDPEEIVKILDLSQA